MKQVTVWWRAVYSDKMTPRDRAAARPENKTENARHRSIPEKANPTFPPDNKYAGVLHDDTDTTP